jgi:hypothetical protein
MLRILESGAFLPLDPRSGMEKKSGSERTSRIFFLRTLYKFFGLKLLKFFDADPVPGFC